ncbi:hypothetical protein DFH08DRAFT_799780 [Mycena albidolilacea]|uniref:Uncharacterized protein n=1 Tax=Mycena albidolilacea TaxID=1033008 RepID=A0AAD7F1A6_9AGAR|nr:hypothetical protein DFH08DRAFT_799780 [Mycena albidolilacea]
MRSCIPRVDAALRSPQVDELQDYPLPFESLRLSGSPVVTTSPGGLGGMDSLFLVDSAASWNESDLATHSWRILAIFLSNSTEFHRNRPGLLGVVHYSYFKLLLPKAPRHSELHLYQAFAPPTLLTAAPGSQAQCITPA